MQEWADDIRKSDERCEFFRHQCDDIKKRKKDVEQRLAETEKKRLRDFTPFMKVAKT
jgi:hypothetical protein